MSSCGTDLLAELRNRLKSWNASEVRNARLIVVSHFPKTRTANGPAEARDVWAFVLEGRIGDVGDRRRINAAAADCISSRRSCHAAQRIRIGHSFVSLKELSASVQQLSRSSWSTGFKCLYSLEEQRKDWFSKLPSESGELWKWCLDQNQDTLLQLLAFCAARSLNGVKTKADVGGRGRLKNSNELAIALDIDMRRWFAPTAEDFFSKVSKARITEALTEPGKPPIWDTAKLKKADFAAFAEKEIEGTTSCRNPSGFVQSRTKRVRDERPLHARSTAPAR